jgi:site-specific DNA-methyltransferase (adenine-specific)
MIKKTIGKHLLYCGDCLEVMPSMERGIADIVLTDPPYLCLDIHWDKELDIPAVVENINGILKKNSFFVFFGKGDTFYQWNLLAKNFSENRVDIVWSKRSGRSFLAPVLRVHENAVIRSKGKKTINRVQVDRIEQCVNENKLNRCIDDLKQIKLLAKHKPEALYRYLVNGEECYDGDRWKQKDTTVCNSEIIKEDRNLRSLKIYIKGQKETSVITIGNEEYNHRQHPTQKPVELLERLLNLTKQDGDTVVDPFMGSGSTGVACEKLGLKFIGIEKEEKYFEIACKRIEQAVKDSESLLIKDFVSEKPS